MAPPATTVLQLRRCASHLVYWSMYLWWTTGISEYGQLWSIVVASDFQWETWLNLYWQIWSTCSWFAWFVGWVTMKKPQWVYAPQQALPPDWTMNDGGMPDKLVAIPQGSRTTYRAVSQTIDKTRGRNALTWWYLKNSSCVPSVALTPPCHWPQADR